MSFTFDDSNTLRNVGIHNANNELIVMNINASSDNISLHSSTNTNNVDTLSIKTLLNKDTNKDLNLSKLQFKFSAYLRVPALPGIQYIFLTFIESLRFLHKACSLPPLPIKAKFM